MIPAATASLPLLQAINGGGNRPVSVPTSNSIGSLGNSPELSSDLPSSVLSPLDSYQDSTGSSGLPAAAALAQHAATAAPASSPGVGASIYIRGMPEDSDKLWLYEKFARRAGACKWACCAFLHGCGSRTHAARHAAPRRCCSLPALPLCPCLPARRFGAISSVRLLIDDATGKCNGECCPLRSAWRVRPTCGLAAATQVQHSAGLCLQDAMVAARLASWRHVCLVGAAPGLCASHPTCEARSALPVWPLAAQALAL